MMRISQRRREEGRWRILQILEAGRPVGCNEAVIQRVLESVRLHYSVAELREELIVMQKLGLVEIEQQDGEVWAIDQQDVEDGEVWAARLSFKGIATVELSMTPPACVARPRGEPR